MAVKLKPYQVRLEMDMWLFLKRTAAEQERSMNDVLVECLEKYKKRIENKLT